MCDDGRRENGIEHCGVRGRKKKGGKRRKNLFATFPVCVSHTFARACAYKTHFLPSHLFNIYALRAAARRARSLCEFVCAFRIHTRTHVESILSHAKGKRVTTLRHDVYVCMGREGKSERIFENRRRYRSRTGASENTTARRRQVIGFRIHWAWVVFLNVKNIFV